MRYLYTLLCLLPLMVTGQADTINYIKTTAYRQPTTVSNETLGVSTITYYDGLGRPLQHVASKASPTQKDIITHIEYDKYNRQPKEYLPYASLQSNSAYDKLSKTRTNEYYNTSQYEMTQNPYSQAFYEPSPLNRILKQAAPGDPWQGTPDVYNTADHSVKFDYQTNTTGEVRNFRVKFDLTKATGPDKMEKPELEYKGYYAANQLYKKIIRNENWVGGKVNTVEEFTDKAGKLILKRTFVANLGVAAPVDTYYVYDIYNNLTYVIPPLATDQILAEQFVPVHSGINAPWVDIVKIDDYTRNNYNNIIRDYSNSEILDVNLMPEYKGRGGFTVSADPSAGLVFSINITTIGKFEYNNGIIMSLDQLGTFVDGEIGSLAGTGYAYNFLIRNNAIVVEGSGEVPSVTKTFADFEKLAHAKNYPWVDFCDIDPKEALRYHDEVSKMDNADILTTYIENDYQGTGGLSIAISEDDEIAIDMNIGVPGETSMLSDIAITLDSKRPLQNMVLGYATGATYSYRFEILDNQLVISGSGNFDYLNFSRRRRPLPEVATSAERLCYIYHYDRRNRVVEKHIPDNGWTHIIYDQQDRPIQTQDENQRLVLQGEMGGRPYDYNLWSFTAYDEFGRIAYTGIRRDMLYGPVEGRRYEMQQIESSNVLDQNKFSVKRAATPFNTAADNLDVFYTPSLLISLTYDIHEIHTVNYYDDHNFDINAETVGYNEMPEGNYYMYFTNNHKGLLTGGHKRVLGTSKWITDAIGYDTKGRPVWNWTYNDYLNSWLQVHTHLGFTGEVLETLTQHRKGSDAALSITDKYNYDHTGRLLDHKQTFGNLPEELIAQNEYDELGQLITKKVGNTTATPLQTVNYKYNIRGWLKQINDPANLGTDLFAFGIDYENVGGYSKYNGNIARTRWKSITDNVARSFTYEYDGLERITEAGFTENGVAVSNNEGSIKYDKNGNILQLHRSGYLGNETYGLIDKLAYFYKPFSNQLLSVTDNSGNILGYNDQNDGSVSHDFEYDANGNMVRDLDKKIGLVPQNHIAYNHLNLPINIIRDADHRIDYVYDADGQKLEKKVTDGYGTLNDIDQTHYAHGFVYLDNVLEYFPHPEGYVRRNPNGTYNYVYQYRDHLDNVRMAYADVNRNGEIKGTELLQEQDFYPFGLEFTHTGTYSASSNFGQKLKYNGKEFQDELGLNLYDYGARNYDPAIGRWFNIDPAAEQGRRFSPYVYAFNNPVYFIDPDGMWPFPSWNQVKSFASGVKSGAVKYVNELKRSVSNIPSAVRKATSSPQAAASFIANNHPQVLVYKAVAGNFKGGYEVAKNVVQGNASGAGEAYGEHLAAGVTMLATDGAVRGLSAAKAKLSTAPEAATAAEAPVTNELYQRPSNATTPEMREYANKLGQEQGCSTCGQEAQKFVADHKTPLVKEHYETGTINAENMRSLDAIQPQCTTCSAKQGAELSKYSKGMKKIIKERTQNGD